MGYASHSVENLGPPFLLVDEFVFLIPRASTLPLRKHHFKLLLVLGGCVEHEIEGLDGRQPLQAGDILVAPVVQRHDYINPNAREAASLQVIRIFFDTAHLDLHARRRVRRPETDFSDFVLHHFARVTQLRNAIDSEITELIERFRTETDARAPGYRHRARALCVELIVAVARRLEHGRAGGGLSRGSNAAQIVAVAKEYILKHFNAPLTLGEISWHVRKGEEHLARVFKRQTGQSVFEYLREVRIHHAKTLLQDASLSLTAIAERCGFHSLSFFSRAFRDQVGISPSGYRGHTSSSTIPRHRAPTPTRRQPPTKPRRLPRP